MISHVHALFGAADQRHDAEARGCRYIIDADGQRLGRVASLIARYLRGKHLPTYTPSMDMGSRLIIINCEKIIVLGRKTDDKLYRRHTTGRPGSMKVETFRQMQARIPERIIEEAVWGMLPKGRLGRRIKLNMSVRPRWPGLTLWALLGLVCWWFMLLLPGQRTCM